MSSEAPAHTAKANQENAILHVDFSRGIVKDVARAVKHAVPNIADRLSYDGQAIVQCGTFRCLAVAKGNGKWADLKGNALKDVRAVVYRF